MNEREMTLQEWVERLPEIHAARREYNALRQRLANTELELTHATKTCAEQQWRAEQAQARLAAAEMLLEAVVTAVRYRRLIDANCISAFLAKTEKQP